MVIFAIIADIAASVFASEIAVGLAALGHMSGCAVALELAGSIFVGLDGLTADTHPAKAMASSAPVCLNRIKSTPDVHCERYHYAMTVT